MMAPKQYDPLKKKKRLDEERLLEPKYKKKKRLKIGMSFGKGVHMVKIS